MLENFLFYFFSLSLVAFAFGVVACRSAVYSVLSLVAAMGMMAALFVLLKAYLVATVLILVYAGAILVLFLFVVMLIDFKAVSFDWSGFGLNPLTAVALGAIFFAQFICVIHSLPSMAHAGVEGTTQAVGKLLFEKYVLPFELTSFLLLAAVVSVVVLAKKDAQP